MLRTLSVAAVIAATVLATPSAVANPRENAMNHIATAMAIGSLCSELDINPTLIAMVARGYGVDLTHGGADVAEVTSRAQEQVLTFQDDPESEVCIVGVVTYGPEGLTVPGLLQKAN